eukprot:Hpha_TRINITY_DN545_c0_g1::TRINITY_DN545_c0_g1_i1::g.171661::m.171661
MATGYGGHKTSSWNCCCFFSVPQNHVKITESLGKFQSVAGPGCHCYNPCLTELQPGVTYDYPNGFIPMKYRYLTLSVHSVTKDKVHMTVEVVVHYRVLTIQGAEEAFGAPTVPLMGDTPTPGQSVPSEMQPLLTEAERIMNPTELQTEMIKKAYYSLSDPVRQLETWVESMVRGQIPEYTIDGVYQARDKIADDLKSQLEAQVGAFGYTIHTVLLVDMMPSADTRRSMNEVNSARRHREAARFDAEAQAKALVLRAEGEAESQRQSGIGLAEQRKAVVQGLQESIAGFSNSVHGVNSKEVMMMLLMNQYFDTLKEIAERSQTDAVFLSNATAGAEGVRDGQMQASAAGK